PRWRAERVEQVLDKLLAEYPEPLTDGQRAELREILIDVDQVRKDYRGRDRIQGRCAELVRRAGGQHEALTAAIEARSERTGDTLRRFEWALVAVLEARLPVTVRPADDDVEALLLGASLLLDAGELELSARWYEAVLETAPDHVEARAMRAWTRWLL